MISPLIIHIFQRFKKWSIFIKDIWFFEKLFFMMIIPSRNKQKSFWRYSISCEIRNIKFILNHNSLSHIVQYLITINEFRPCLQIENSGMNPSLETIFQLEISWKMIMKESCQFICDVLISSTISETKVMISSINTEILGSDAWYFINHCRDCFYLITVYLSLFVFFIFNLFFYVY